MELFKGGKSENTSGYSEEEGKKIDAFVSKMHAVYLREGASLDPGMLVDAIITAAAGTVGTGFKDRAAFTRNAGRMTESFLRVMTWAFDQAEAKRRAPK